MTATAPLVKNRSDSWTRKPESLGMRRKKETRILPSVTER